MMKMRPNEEVQKNRDNEKFDNKEDTNAKGVWSKQENLAPSREQTLVKEGRKNMLNSNGKGNENHKKDLQTHQW